MLDVGPQEILSQTNIVEHEVISFFFVGKENKKHSSIRSFGKVAGGRGDMNDGSFFSHERMKTRTLINKAYFEFKLLKKVLTFLSEMPLFFGHHHNNESPQTW